MPPTPSGNPQPATAITKPAPKTKAKSNPTKGSGTGTVASYTQATFQSQIRALTAPFGNSGSNAYGGQTQIQRGFMIWDKTQMPPGYNTPAVVKFLFNPSTVSATYGVQSSGVQASINFPTAASQATPAFPMQQNVSFSLLFDRTYEVYMGGSGANNADASTSGCEVDVMAMKQFSGMFVNAPAYGNTNPTNGKTNTQGKPSFTQIAQGGIIPIMSYVYFGGITAGQSYGVKYYGYVDSWDVTYTHFSSTLIPMRCAIDIDFVLLPPPTKATSEDAAISQSQLSGLSGEAGAGGPAPTPNGQSHPAPFTTAVGGGGANAGVAGR